MNAELIFKMLGINPAQLLEQVKPQIETQIRPVIEKANARLTAVENDLAEIKRMLQILTGESDEERSMPVTSLQIRSVA